MGNDYEDLLRMYSDEPDEAPKKRNSQKDEVKSLEQVENERRKKVDDFKIDFDADSSADKRSYNPGVYFSNPPKGIKNEAQREKRAFARKDTTEKKLQVSAPPTTEKQKKMIALKEEKAKKRANTFWGKFLNSERLSRLVFAVAIIVFFSVILCVYGIGCINDILAIDSDDYTVEVQVSQGWTDNEVIDVLGDNKLIRHELFCKIFVKFFGHDGDYVSGVYTLNKKDGLEKMLATMKADITLSETVNLTFPEGWTIDQIAEKLEANEVCTAASFINTLQSVDFSEEYSFIAAIPNKELRFRTLEGYIYPDTYEFYVGENASSVVRRFLDNFENRWTDEYQKQADKLGVSIDEVITLASILQEEAASSDQMPEISSVIYNRLNRPSSFPRLECDSTQDYFKEYILPTLTSSVEDMQKEVEYRYNYDTYSTECTGLPVGAIANPGDAAIRAALNPAETDYLFFCHDEEGKVYYAATDSEHERNKRQAGL